ncbi:MAG: COX15/CtaA family protein, partial [Rhodospirillales bacterium]|nr:COX15/CtaA family protein [Acetobacter sp.]
MSNATVQRTASTGATYAPWRHAYTVFMALSILALICSGGLVTSNDAGLAVPDWPTSYGYNMFAFPLSRWLAPGGVRLEHSHRLIATGEGMLSIVLAAWFWSAEPRRWVRNLAYLTLFAVILQGLFGGLRVVLRADWIGVPHALLAQAFFALVAFIALTQSRWWQRLGEGEKDETLARKLRPMRRHVACITALIYLQLGLGAAMRHAHAGLSILDFPKAYGHWWPHVHKADLPALNAERTDILHMPPTSLGQIHLQMTHRMLAFVIFLGVVAAAVAAWRRGTLLPIGLRRLAYGWPLALAMQVTLGMYVIWTGKAADVATAHVAVGAMSLVWGVMLYAALRRWSSSLSAAEPEATSQVPNNV